MHWIWLNGKSTCVPIFSKRQRITLRLLMAITIPCVCRLSSVICRLSSVCDVGAPYSAGWTFRQFFSPYDSPVTLVFWCQKIVGGGRPFPNKNLPSKWRTPFKTAKFRHISAHSASTMIDSEKSSISTYRKSTTRFPTSHRWTVYVIPKSPKGWHKNAISLFVPVKFNFCRKKSATKLVSLYENFQRQSCSYIIPLSNGP